MVRWMRWHCPPDTGFEIRALAVLGRARYPSVTEAPHNIESLRMSKGETFCLFETWRSECGSNPRSPTFQEGGFNHCTRSPTTVAMETAWAVISMIIYRIWAPCPKANQSSQSAIQWHVPLFFQFKCSFPVYYIAAHAIATEMGVHYWCNSSAHLLELWKSFSEANL